MVFLRPTCGGKCTPPCRVGVFLRRKDQGAHGRTACGRLCHRIGVHFRSQCDLYDFVRFKRRASHIALFFSKALNFLFCRVILKKKSFGGMVCYVPENVII